MLVSEALKQAIKESGMTQARLAKALGYRGQSSIAERVKGNITVENMLAMMDAIGYEVVIQKKKPGRRPEGQLALELKKDGDSK